MNKAQWKVISWLCFILSGLLLLKVIMFDMLLPYTGEVLDILNEVFPDPLFYLAVVLAGAGFVIRVGVKNKKEITGGKTIEDVEKEEKK